MVDSQQLLGALPQDFRRSFTSDVSIDAVARGLVDSEEVVVPVTGHDVGERNGYVPDPPGRPNGYVPDPPGCLPNFAAFMFDVGQLIVFWEEWVEVTYVRSPNLTDPFYTFTFRRK